MSTFVECAPAYGRDYRSAKEVKTAWTNGNDFIVQEWGSRYDQKPINREDANREHITVLLRYKRLTQVVVIPPSKS